MKLKIKYQRVAAVNPIEPIAKGEWIDLYLAQKTRLAKGEYKILSLGIRMKLPEGFEAWMVPRSSTFKNFKLIMTNSVGIIDSSYQGPTDVWGFPAIAMEDIVLLPNKRICQFRIMPSQKASFWTKLKWLFVSGIEFVEEDWISRDRGGFGSTGV
jgi:dUTP pyrophosphatase